MSVLAAAGFDPATLLATVENPEAYEVVDGELRERVMSLEATAVMLATGSELRQWLKRNPIGVAFGSEAQYQCFAHRPAQIRKPDVSVILRSRLPEGPLPQGYAAIVPDLVAIVVSPDDTASDILDRIDDFRAAGTPIVWVLYPTQPRVFVHTAAGVRDLGVADEIDAEPVLPGFRARVADFFAA